MKKIKDKIEELLDPVLVRDFEQASKEGVEGIIPYIEDQIINSNEYSQLVTNVIHDLKADVSEILENLEHSPISDLYYPKAKPSDNSFSAASGTTIESGSIEGSSVSSIGVSLCSEDLRVVLTQLQTGQPLTTRREAIKKVALVSIGDLIADEFWDDSKRLLECGLLDNDLDIVNITLKIYAHAFKSAPPYMAPEIYLSLLSTLQQSFDNNPPYLLSNGLDIHDSRIILKLKQFRLLRQFMCEITSLWFRFSEKTFKE